MVVFNILCQFRPIWANCLCSTFLSNLGQFGPIWANWLARKTAKKRVASGSGSEYEENKKPKMPPKEDNHSLQTVMAALDDIRKNQLKREDLSKEVRKVVTEVVDVKMGIKSTN